MGVKKAAKKGARAAKTATRTKASPENIRKLKESIEKHRREGKYEHFASVADVRTEASPENIRKLKESIEKHRREGKYEHFASVADEDIEKMLIRSNTPFFSSWGWSNTMPGGTFNLSVNVFNPDPVAVGSMYVHTFIGPALAVVSNDTALLAVDARWNRLAEPQFFGMSLAPSTSGNVSFTVAAPATIERSNYFGNLFLIRRGSGVASVLDRQSYVFRVT